MADMRQNFTMQGFGNPVSAAGQGEQAGPQASSSCYRSSSVVGNLATEEFNATRIYHLGSGDQECDLNKRDSFCYICSQYEVKKNRRSINQNVKDEYEEIFGLKVISDEFEWVPKIICSLCSKMLRIYKTKKIRPKMIVPTVWKEPHSKEDCYFCNTNLCGINNKNKSKINYANVQSVIKPVYSSPPDQDENSLDISVGEQMDVEQSLAVNEENESLREGIEEMVDDDKEAEKEILSDSNSDDIDSYNSDTSSESYTPYNVKKEKTSIPQEKVNDLVRDLGLPKDGAEFLASWLKKILRNVLK